jgi:predicted nucleic acid-binding protein
MRWKPRCLEATTGSSGADSTSSKPFTAPAGVPVPENVGVVDAGVILTRLDRRRRSHPAAIALFASGARGAARLHISIVNLAEALQHSRAYSEATGVDLVAVLGGFDVIITAPDVDIARRVADLSALGDASLADRFALATAQALGARLHTTDRVLAGLARRCRLPTTLY